MLFDNWANTTYDDGGQSSRNVSTSQLTSPSLRHASLASPINNLQRELEGVDSAMFTLERLQWQAGTLNSDSTIVAFSTANNMLNIVTNDRGLIIWDLNNETHSVIALSRRNDVVPRKIWTSPSQPSHILISASGGILIYVNDAIRKPVVIKSGNANIDSVSWVVPGKQSELALLGSDSGTVYQLNLASKDKTLRKLHQLPEISPICGIEIELFTDSLGIDRYLVMCATRTRLYEYVGLHPEAAFKCDSAPFIELHGNVSASPALYFFREDGRAKTVVWLTGCGLYHGKLQFDGRHETSSTVIADYHLLPYPIDAIDKSIQEVEGPVGVAVTRFHFLLLYAHRLICYNQLTSAIVYDSRFPESAGEMISISRDPLLGSVFVYSTLQLYEFIIDREDRDIWLHFLNKKEFGSALEFCSTAAQRDQVLCAHGDYLFDQGDYKPAAAIYSQSQRPFENIALLFLKEDRSRDALKDFLRRRLDSVPVTALTQRTMICTWLTEIYLDKLNTLRDSLNDDVFEDLITEFVDFLSVYRNSLDRNTTFDLISSHGRTNELLSYAEIIGAHDWVILYSIEQQRYKAAIDLIVAHCASNVHIMQLMYRVAPQLVQNDPDSTIDAFIKLGSIVDGVRILPALHRCETPSPGQTFSPALRYLQTIIHEGNRNPILHNYMISLMVKLPDEDVLLEYLEDQTSDSLFDTKLALRLCHQEGKRKSCVRLYQTMSLFREATSMALTVSPQLAKEVALSLDSNSTVSAADRKAIWLSIGRHLLEQCIKGGGTLPEAIESIKGCSPHIQIEDMLPFFPDDLRIGDFRSEIVSCLRQYNERLKVLHDDQEALSNAATALKKDLQSLRNRTASVKHNQVSRLLFDANSEVDGVAYQCAQAELDRMQELIGSERKPIFDSDGDDDDDDETASVFDVSNNAASSCILCGDDIIQTVDVPLDRDCFENLKL